jgi:hypothetical protein
MAVSRLDATIVTVTRDEAFNCRTVGFYRPVENEVLVLELQRTLRATAQDRELGWDTHCLVIGAGRTKYGCVLECILRPGELSLRVSKQTAAYLHIGDQMAVTFDSKKTAMVRRALMAIFKPPKSPKVMDLDDC